MNSIKQIKHSWKRQSMNPIKSSKNLIRKIIRCLFLNKEVLLQMLKSNNHFKLINLITAIIVVSTLIVSNSWLILLVLITIVVINLNAIKLNASLSLEIRYGKHHVTSPITLYEPALTIYLVSIKFNELG